MVTINNRTVEEYLKEAFEDNFNELKLESGRSITYAMKEYAWQQIYLYWKKLNHVAERITETEVKLILPDQCTPMNRKYTIEGVVDIVHEEDKITMYDIKTHSALEVVQNSSMYKEQLNVYAYMWKNLRNSNIDNISIIATAPPNSIKEILLNKDNKSLEKELEKWNPVIKLDFTNEKVEESIKAFGETVDKIENGEFSPPPIEKLKKVQSGQKAAFGTAVCRHCDARFSCSSYQMYIKKFDYDQEVIREIKIDEEIEREQWREAFIDAGM
jgi:hypothetical protein